jgi:hypothetical protein
LPLPTFSEFVVIVSAHEFRKPLHAQLEDKWGAAGPFDEIQQSVVTLTKAAWRGDAHEFVRNIGRGKGSRKVAAAVYFWLHQNDPSRAEQVDLTVFGKSLAAGDAQELSMPQQQVAVGYVPDLVLDTISSPTEHWLSPLNFGAIPFFGRSSERALLNAFAEDPSLFQLWALVAPSGAGKTRLVSEWMHTELAPAGWYCGFLRDKHTDHWQSWNPSAPTLIVIDYLHEYVDALKGIFSRCDALRRTGQLNYPVRVLVLERYFPKGFSSVVEDYVWGKIARSEFDRHSFMRSFFNDAVPLAFDHDDDQRSIISEILAFLIRSSASDDAVTNVREQLARMPGAFHPLFAALAGRAVASGLQIDNWNRHDLIESYLAGSHRLPWMERADIGKWVACMVSAATIKHGASLARLETWLPKSLEPSQVREIRHLARWIVGAEDEVGLPPLSPQLLGEAFFGLFLRDFGGSPAMLNHLTLMIAEQSQSAGHESGTEGLDDGLRFIEFFTGLARNLASAATSATDDAVILNRAISYLVPTRFERKNLYVGDRLIGRREWLKWSVSAALVEIARIVPSTDVSAVDFYDLLYAIQNTSDIRPMLAAMKYYDLLFERGEVPEHVERHMIDVAESPRWHRPAQMMVLAAEEGFDGVVNFLIDAGRDINAASFGYTPLTAAAEFGQAKVLRTLISRGARVNKKIGRKKTTALIAAMLARQTEATKILLTAGADVRPVRAFFNLSEGNDEALYQALMELANSNEHSSVEVGQAAQ